MSYLMTVSTLKGMKILGLEPKGIERSTLDHLVAEAEKKQPSDWSEGGVPMGYPDGGKIYSTQIDDIFRFYVVRGLIQEGSSFREDYSLTIKQDGEILTTCSNEAEARRLYTLIEEKKGKLHLS